MFVAAAAVVGRSVLSWSSKGRNVILGKTFGSPTITKDGVTVATEIELRDPLENMGAQMGQGSGEQDVGDRMNRAVQSETSPSHLNDTVFG
jgi:hypothetical protein